MSGWVKNTTWLNGKSYLTQEELFKVDYIHIINKLSLVLASDKYFEDTKVFCRSVLSFAIDHEFITWKQANAVLKIKTTAERREVYGYFKNTTTVFNPFIYARSSMTDRDTDNITRNLFGNLFYKELEQGYDISYRDDGSRYFTL